MSNDAAQVRLLIVDDHHVVREGLSTYIEIEPRIELAGEAASGEEALSLLDQVAPDVVLMDLLMPGMGGIAATSEVLARRPDCRVIVLTSFADPTQIQAAIRAGASGYLLKDVQAEEMVQAIIRVHEGQGHLQPAVAERLMQVMREGSASGSAGTGARLQTLTERELQVLRLIAAGHSNKELASLLGISERTVKGHVSSILDKLDLADRTQAAVFAVKHGLDTD